MIFIVGLGNPGDKFKNTRHNVGFNALNHFALKNEFSQFLKDKKSNSLIAEGFIDKRKILLIKPQTFMNLSGKSVKVSINYHNNKKEGLFSFLIKKIKKEKISFANLIIVHDDKDIEIGKIKISKKRGAGGHNGVKSIIKELNTNDFIRIRVGIKSINKENSLMKTSIASFVLGKFENQEKIIIQKKIQEIEQKINELITSIV